MGEGKGKKEGGGEAKEKKERERGGREGGDVDSTFVCQNFVCVCVWTVSGGREGARAD